MHSLREPGQAGARHCLCEHRRAQPVVPAARSPGQSGNLTASYYLGYYSQIMQRKSSSKPAAGQALAAALSRVLRPLFRVVLRNHMSFKAFLDIAKRAYVEVAANEFHIPGKKQSVSRVALLSGLTRKEVQRLLETPAANDSDAGERYNRAARVVAGWVRDPEFSDASGNPRVLPLQDGAQGEGSFAEIVRRFSGDIPFRAVLDELLRVGVVERLDDDRVRLKSRAYVPESGDADKLNILGTDVADLVDTIDHNLQHGGADPFFQRKVMYDNVPVEALQEFRRLSGAEAQALLERFDKWLSQRDRDSHPGTRGTGRMRTGIGIYYFEENMASQTPKDS